MVQRCRIIVTNALSHNELRVQGLAPLAGAPAKPNSILYNNLRTEKNFQIGGVCNGQKPPHGV